MTTNTETKEQAPAEPQQLSRVVTFATAGLGGVLGWICIHPCNTVAIRMNLNSMGNPEKMPNFFNYTKRMIAKEGVLTLYSGLSAGITRQIFYATSRFGLFEVFRDKMAQYRETDLFSRLLTGCASGAAAAFISCPAEVSLVRISNDKSLPEAQRRNYKNVFDAAAQIMKKEGVATFWRGSAPFVNRAMLVGATQVGTYDQFKEMYANAGVPRGIPNVFCAAMTAGLLYSCITMPFEAVKNRMAFQTPGPNGELVYKTTFQSLKHIVRTEGFMSFYSGFLPYYGRCGGHTVSMFIAVEQLRKMYRNHLANK